MGKLDCRSCVVLVARKSGVSLVCVFGFVWILTCLMLCVYCGSGVPCTLQAHTQCGLEAHVLSNKCCWTRLREIWLVKTQVAINSKWNVELCHGLLKNAGMLRFENKLMFRTGRSLVVSNYFYGELCPVVSLMLGNLVIWFLSKKVGQTLLTLLNVDQLQVEFRCVFESVCSLLWYFLIFQSQQQDK